MKKWIVRFFGSFGFIGFIPGMPGTLGSAAGVAISWLLVRRLGVSWQTYLLICGAVGFVSFYFAERCEESFNKSDPGSFILDEVFGQMLAMLLVPYSWKAYAMGFLYFRFFDIIKPYPVGEAERVEGGAGIMMDDAVSGFMSCVLLHVTLFVYHTSMAYLTK